MKKVLLLTDKPFAQVAIDGIQKVVTDAGYELKLCEKYGTDMDRVKRVAEDVDALIIRSDKVTPEIMDAAPNLKIIVRAGAGYDNVDLEAATHRGICVMNTPGQNSNAVAELAFGMMVMAVRNMYNGTSGFELKGKKLGIHAYGNVGRNVARIAKGFGMEIYAFDAYCPKELIEADGVIPVENPEALYETCNIVSIHIPATPETKKSLNYDLLSKMPKGAALINTARKEVVDEEGLEKVLAERADFKYASDVAPENLAQLMEKYPAQVFATAKKMGAETAEANMNAGLAAARQIVDFLVNGNRRFQVNK
jgi:D-3-phosphoglycerate dehydrogenase